MSGASPRQGFDLDHNCMLATFDITKALDEDGKEIELSYEFDSGFIRYSN